MHLEYLKREHLQIIDGVEHRLAEQMETELSELQPEQMRGFFERKVPLVNLKAITYSATPFCKLCETLCRQRKKLKSSNDSSCAAELHYQQLTEIQSQVAMGLVFCKQVALDSGKYELAWLLTGLQRPPFHLIEKNTKIYGHPYGQLADARWMGINLYFLKGTDYFEEGAR